MITLETLVEKAQELQGKLEVISKDESIKPSQFTYQTEKIYTQIELLYELSGLSVVEWNRVCGVHTK